MSPAKATRRYYKDPWVKISSSLGVAIEQANRLTLEFYYLVSIMAKTQKGRIYRI